MLWTAFLIVAIAIGFYVLYRALHWAFPSWGTVMTNVLSALAMLIDFSAQIPWGTIVDSKEAAVIAFVGAVLGNVLARLNGPKAPVGAS
jgi:hypothetical protein